MNAGSEVLYHEEQGLSNLIKYLVLGSEAFTLAVVIVVFSLVRTPRPTTLLVMSICLSSMGIGIVFIFLLKLITEVRSDGIYVRLWPMWFKRFGFDEIESYGPRKYSPIKEYGGWGIRYSPSNGRAYNMRGDMGVQLELRGGKRVLIGSQRSEELAEVMRNAVDLKV